MIFLAWHPTQLQWVGLPMVSNENCKTKWGEQFWEKEMICAGFLKTGAPNTCSGDSGGPLVCHQNGQTVLTGIVSFGMKPCTKDHPKVFARVSNYIEWIRENMENQTIKLSTTTTIKTTTTGKYDFDNSQEYEEYGYSNESMNSHEYDDSQEYDTTTEFITSSEYVSSKEDVTEKEIYDTEDYIHHRNLYEDSQEYDTTTEFIKSSEYVTSQEDVTDKENDTEDYMYHKNLYDYYENYQE